MALDALRLRLRAELKEIDRQLVKLTSARALVARALGALDEPVAPARGRPKPERGPRPRSARTTTAATRPAAVRSIATTRGRPGRPPGPGVTPGTHGYRVVELLRDHAAALTVTEICEELKLTPDSCKQVLVTLRKRGFIENRSEGRTGHYEVTVRGVEALAAAGAAPAAPRAGDDTPSGHHPAA